MVNGDKPHVAPPLLFNLRLESTWTPALFLTTPPGAPDGVKARQRIAGICDPLMPGRAAVRIATARYARRGPSDLQAIRSALSDRNAAAAGPTTGVVPAAADEVSALTAAQFTAHAQMYQAVSAQAGAVHDMFVTTLAASASSYAATEAANTIAAS